MQQVHTSESPESIRRCFPVMQQLRPHLDLANFESQVARQIAAHGYRLAYVEEGGEVAAVAGYRIAEYLAWGKAMYVDDLVTDERRRGRGLGSVLIDWLVAEAKREGCGQFHLDSGVQRFGAHRFYLHKGMDITSHHFAMGLG